MANFKVGDEVVCVDAVRVHPVPNNKPFGLTLGAKYKVLAILGPSCAVVNDGDTNVGTCEICGVFDGHSHRYHWRFIKLDGLKEESEERNALEA